MKPKEIHKCDVFVIGTGITGLSALFHLQKLGIRRVGWSSAPAIPAVSRHSSGRIFGGFYDNFSRLSHVLTPNVAAELWNFGNLAFDTLYSFCGHQSIPNMAAGHHRIFASDHEWKECIVACEQLNAAGFETSIGGKSSPFLPLIDLAATSGQMYQNDGMRGGWVDAAMLLGALEQEAAKASGPKITHSVKSVCFDPGVQQMEITFENDPIIVHSEVCIIAAHLQSGRLIPQLEPALISTTEQSIECEFEYDHTIPVGLAFSLNHSLEWGVASGPRKMQMGGARFLRPLGGIGQQASTFDPRINHYLEKRLQALLGGDRKFRILKTLHELECRPCDELPVIGPMYGENRLLVATGYSGQGLTIGFHAGKCLAELINCGISSELPRILWPERLRSLDWN